MFSDDKKELEDNDNVGYIKKYSFIGTIDGWDKKLDEPIITVRNQFRKGDEIDILMPGKMPERKTADCIMDGSSLKPVQTANPNDRVIIKGLKGISRYSIFRIKR
jgi:hypothetical protein